MEWRLPHDYIYACGGGGKLGLWFSLACDSNLQLCDATCQEITLGNDYHCTATHREITLGDDYVVMPPIRRLLRVMTML